MNKPDLNDIHIVCAANRYRDMIIPAPRHYDGIMRALIYNIWPKADERRQVRAEMEQGFIDQRGNFYTRKEAMKIIANNKQPFDVVRNRVDDVLYSEGLY